MKRTNYELTFLTDWVYGSVPMKAFEVMIVRELHVDVVELINNNIAVITKVIRE